MIASNARQDVSVPSIFVTALQTNKQKREGGPHFDPLLSKPPSAQGSLDCISFSCPLTRLIALAISEDNDHAYCISPPPSPPYMALGTSKVLHNDRIYLRITLESRVRSGSSCFLGLRYELSALAPSATVTIDLMPGPTTSAVSASFDPSFEAFEVGGEPGGRKELRQTVSLSCSRPFSFPPEIAVVVTTGGREPPTITRVSLPVTVSTFLRGLPLNTDDFRQMWTALSSSGQITQAIVRDGDHRPAFGSVQGPRWGASVQPSDIRRLLFETMGMSEVPWKDKSGVGNIDLIAASGFMPLSPPGSREKGSIVCLVGVEIHGATGSARVTTKSTDRVLAEGIQREVMGGIDVAHRFHR